MEKTGRELRQDKRRSLGAAGATRVHVTGERGTFAAKTVDLSPGGVGLVTREIRSLKLPRLNETVTLIYRRGTDAELRVSALVRNMNFAQVGDVVVVRIGLSFVDSMAGAYAGGEVASQEAALLRSPTKGHAEGPERIDGKADGIPPRIESAIVDCPPFFLPSAFCDDPFFFEERIHFQVTGFSPRGMRLVCSARNKSVIVGVGLRLTLFLPMIGTFEIPVRAGVARAIVGDDKYVLDATFTSEEAPFLENVSRYLIFTGAVSSVEALLSKGFPVRSVERFLQFVVVATPEDREHARFFRGETPEDPNGRLVLCRLGKDALGAGQIAFVKGNGPLGAVEQGVARLPTRLREEGYAEVSWACGANNPHIPDAFMHFVKNFARMVLEAGVRTMVTTCQRDAWPVYRALGFEALEAEFLPGAANKETALVVGLDVPGVIRGTTKVHRSVWTRLYKPVAEHLGLIGRTLDYGGRSAPPRSKAS